LKFNKKKINFLKAGKKTNEEDIERMLESGNPQIFTEGVSMHYLNILPNQVPISGQRQIYVLDSYGIL